MSKEKLTQDELLFIATKMFEKGYTDSDKVYYCDDLYGNESQAEDVMGFINEIQDIGRIAFKEKYKGINLYF